MFCLLLHRQTSVCSLRIRSYLRLRYQPPVDRIFISFEAIFRSAPLSYTTSIVHGQHARLMSTLRSGMGTEHHNLSLKERLKLLNYTSESLRNAIDGKDIPAELGYPEMQACIIRGIRHHEGFGSELRGYAPFDRALNARMIMSNQVPEMLKQEHIPYCIWHPEPAMEETYRRLVKVYPHMKYQVGRACAVAGYEKLYHELDILPEVAIAEEARDNHHNPGSQAIFKAIMSAPSRYIIMDDYHREINDKSPVSGPLNADTAVFSSLSRKRAYSRLDFEESHEDYDPEDRDTEPNFDVARYEPIYGYEKYWNITEDWSFDHEDSPAEDADAGPLAAADLRIPLLYSPLPRDLPAINKDMLILEAAWSGNIDRYTRLRRKKEIFFVEEQCCIRGIHYSTIFAKWWSLQPEVLITPPESNSKDRVMQAINARFIMDNNLTRIAQETHPGHLPYLIYWPHVAREETYAELYRRQPRMKLQIARACIVGNYEELYKSLDVERDEWLIAEAEASINPFFLQDQLEKEEVDDKGYWGFNEWKSLTVKGLSYNNLTPIFKSSDIPAALGHLPVDAAQEGIWGGNEMNMDAVNVIVGSTKSGLYVDS